MSRGDLPDLRDPRGPGCLRGAVGFVALAVLGPPVAGLRALRRWRRGRDVRGALAERAFAGEGAAAWSCLDLALDVPFGDERVVLDQLTDAVVRIAENLRAADTVVHAVYRRIGETEAVLSPVGPRLHDLGERFSLLMSHHQLERRTVLWLILPADVHLAAVVDPLVDDPEAPGEPDGLVRRIAPCWAAASTFARARSSHEYRLVLYLPQAVEREIESILEGLCRGLGRGSIG